MSTRENHAEETDFHWVEFRTIKDLFSFIITKTMPGQQFLSVIRFKDYTYALAPMNNTVIIFLTKETPRGKIYSWDVEKDDFTPTTRADRTKVNILIQEVAFDSLITKLFYAGK
jgi:hypothetical protein